MSVSITTFGIINGDITTLGIITGIISIEDITPPETPPNYQGAGAGSAWGWNDPPKNFASKYKKINRS